MRDVSKGLPADYTEEEFRAYSMAVYVREQQAKYPLEVENIGEDVYILISRGHHDIHAFMREVRELYNWPLGVPEHIWMKTRPARPGSGYRCFYDVVPQGTRGAWPATHVQEAWGEDSYEAKFPRETRPGA